MAHQAAVRREWHDGTPFSADDVKFTLELINNPHFRALPHGHERHRHQGGQPDRDHLAHEEAATRPIASILSWTFIVPQHILEKADDPNTAPFNNAPVGTGPFQWRERMPGDHITLVGQSAFLGQGPVSRARGVQIHPRPDGDVHPVPDRCGGLHRIQGITADHYNEAGEAPDRSRGRGAVRRS